MIPQFECMHIELSHKLKIGKSSYFDTLYFTVVSIEFRLSNFFICPYPVSYTHLDVYKRQINPFIPCLTYGNMITPTQSFQINHILKNKIDILHIAAKDGLTDTMIRNVVFFVRRKDLFPL